MERVEISIAVEPLSDDLVAQLNAAGFRVYRSQRGWRVQEDLRVIRGSSIRAQAHAAATQLVHRYDLPLPGGALALSLRDPDGELDRAAGELVLEDARRASDPDPTPRPPRKWWQKQMELGLGERKEM